MRTAEEYREGIVFGGMWWAAPITVAMPNALGPNYQEQIPEAEKAV